MVSPQSVTIADVGCDHAYVSIALIQKGLAEKVIAMDVRTGPLDIASKNVREAGLEHSIDIRLGDGLERLLPGEADGIVIAGMGGLLMKGILERGDSVLQCAKKRPTLILQPQSDVKEVRMFLYAKAYHIVSEIMLKEDGKYYTVIKAEPKQATTKTDMVQEMAEAYTEVEWIYGKYNLENKSEVLYEYLRKEQAMLTGIQNKVEESIKTSRIQQEEIAESTRQRLEGVSQELEWNRQALHYYKAVE